jgi:tight adherence protein C
VITAELATAWALLVGCAVLWLTPGPARYPAYAGRPERPRLPERIGRWLLARAGRRQAEPALARRIGLAVVGGAVVMPLGPMAVVPAAAVGWALPGLSERAAARRRQAATTRSLPEIVDLLMLAAGAGLSVRQVVAAVAARADGPLAPVLARAVSEAEQGRRLADALEDVPALAGESTRTLVAPLVACERYGAPLSPALDRLAGEVRADARRRAEEAARRVPVKLLFPLVTCILPAFGLLTVAPLIASAVRSLRL